MKAQLTWVLVMLMACDSSAPQPVLQQPSLLGNWKFVSETHALCTSPSGNLAEQCLGTAAQCGVLNLTETSWTFSRLQSNGSVFTESGGYTVTSNVITLSGGAATPNSLVHVISGAAFTYTSTSLVFITSDSSTGCAITVAFTKHNQPFSPTN